MEEPCPVGASFKRKENTKFNGFSWFMLQTTTDGKYTSVRGAVIVSTVVTTVALIKSK